MKFCGSKESVNGLGSLLRGTRSMEFSSWQDFVAMGGHGLYVWLAYGLTLVVIVFNVIQPMLRRRQIIRQQQLQTRRRQARAKSTQTTKNDVKTIIDTNENDSGMRVEGSKNASST